MVEYPSSEPKLHGWCADGDGIVTCPIWLMAVTKCNLFHPTLVGWSGCGIWCQSLSLGMRCEKQDVAWSDSENLTDRPLAPHI
jgi:hypothetical protein